VRLAVGAIGEAGSGLGLNNDNPGPADNSASSAGAVYLFRRDAAQIWRQDFYIKPLNTSAYDYFGIALALSGDGTVLAVGATDEDAGGTGIHNLFPGPTHSSTQNAGAVYMFAERQGIWQSRAYVKALNTNANDLFGASLALTNDGTKMAVGAYREDGAAAPNVAPSPTDNSASSAGAVYVY
jgi:hypothetical protein